MRPVQPLQPPSSNVRAPVSVNTAVKLHTLLHTCTALQRG